MIHPGIQREPCRILYEPGRGLLKVDTPSGGEKSGETPYMILQGPSGKEEYRLSVKSEMEDDDLAIGSDIQFKDWEVIEESSRLWLRYNDPMRSSHWIAAQATDGAKDSAWSPWWFSPNAANMEDFQHYVSIDIQLVPFP